MQEITTFEICQELIRIHGLCLFYQKDGYSPLNGISLQDSNIYIFLESERLITRCYTFGYRVTEKGISYILNNVGCLLEGDNIEHVSLAIFNILPLEWLSIFLTCNNTLVRNLVKQRIDEILLGKEQTLYL